MSALDMESFTSWRGCHFPVNRQSPTLSLKGEGVLRAYLSQGVGDLWVLMAGSGLTGFLRLPTIIADR